MLMCSNSVFLNDFVDLVRSVRIRLDHAMTCSWTADSIQNLARFFLHLLSKSHLKDLIESSDLQKRRGGTLAFRSLQNPEEDLKIKPAVIPDPVVLIRGRRFVAIPQYQDGACEMEWDEPEGFVWPSDLLRENYNSGTRVLESSRNLHPVGRYLW